MKVSWLITGVRKDPWAESHRIRTEEEKPVKVANLLYVAIDFAAVFC